MTLSAETMTDAAAPVLVVHARAGDEALFTGGTIASLTSAGSSVTVLTCASDAQSESETDAAMAALGVADHRVLGRVDARIAGAPTRRYTASNDGADGDLDALENADPAEVAADIATVIATTGATAVIGPPEDEGARHPDVLVVARAARRAAEVMGVPYSAVTTDSWADAEEVDVSAVLERKAAAVRAYKSRFTVDGDAVVAADGSRMPISSVERFATGAERRVPTSDWSDLGVGGRIIALIVALVLGTVVGALGTVAYQSGPVVADQFLPAGLVGSLLVAAGVLAGLRLVTGTRFVPAAAALGTLGVIAILSQESAGGSVLVPDLPLSYYWLYGPVVIAFLVLAWPDLHRMGRVRIAEASNRKEPQQP